MTFRKTIKETKDLKTIKDTVNPKYEIPRILKKSKKTILFKNPKNSSFKVAGNTYNKRKKIAKSLKTKKEKIINKLKKSLSAKKNPKIIKKGPVQKNVTKNPNLKKLPILTHYEKDGGPYITSGIITAKDSKGNRNLSFHRMKLIDKNKLVIRLVPRDLKKIFDKAEKKDKPLEVSAFIGNRISIALAAATSPSYEKDEYKIAKELDNDLELAKCITNDLEVPTKSEIVLEGKLLPGIREKEGPFVDITETYDAIRKQPVFEVNCMTTRKDPIYQALLPSSPEHQYLMGLPREPLIKKKVSEVTKVNNIALTTGGCGWLHAIVSIQKNNQDDGKKAINSTFKAHSSLKHCVIVDEDINIFDSREVEWAIATRFRADRDSVIKSEVQGSSLDPTADPETRLGSKMGIDATKTLGKEEKFERGKIPKKEV